MDKPNNNSYNNANGNTELHLECVKNNKNKIKDILNNKKKEENIKNNDGELCYHILAKYGNYGTLYEIINELNIPFETLMIKNYNGEDVIDYIESPEILNKILSYSDN
jgi:ankyrin repeat protein